MAVTLPGTGNVEVLDQTSISMTLNATGDGGSLLVVPSTLDSGTPAIVCGAKYRVTTSGGVTLSKTRSENDGGIVTPSTTGIYIEAGPEEMTLCGAGGALGFPPNSAVGGLATSGAPKVTLTRILDGTGK
jgi:hypothetical protein